jgi:hypothetical protein
MLKPVIVVNLTFSFSEHAVDSLLALTTWAFCRSANREASKGAVVVLASLADDPAAATTPAVSLP